MDWKDFDIENRERRINKAGYTEIFLPEHPHSQKGYFLLHRLVMEKYLGRFIELSQVVHHVNENKQDNRIENLWLCENDVEHAKIHRMGWHQPRSANISVRKQRQTWSFERDSMGRFIKKKN